MCSVEAKAPKQYEAVLKKFSTVFEPLQKGLPPERDVLHKIELQPGASMPKARPPYRLSQFEEEECIRQLRTYLDMGHARPSKSPFSAPVLFARKKNGKLRFCVDYRALNNATVKDRFPLPRIDDLLDRLQAPQFFQNWTLHKVTTKCVWRLKMCVRLLLQLSQVILSSW